MTPAQTDTPRPSICLRVYLDEFYADTHPELCMEDFLSNPKAWEYELATDASHAVKAAGEALEACLKKGSKWHPCDPVVVQAQAALSELQRIAKP